MAERGMHKRLTESRHLQDKKSPRNKKRTKLLGKKRVAQQNRAATMAKTDKAATVGTIRRVGEYKRAAKPQFAAAGGAKKFKP